MYGNPIACSIKVLNSADVAKRQPFRLPPEIKARVWLYDKPSVYDMSSQSRLETVSVVYVPLSIIEALSCVESAKNAAAATRVMANRRIRNSVGGKF